MPEDKSWSWIEGVFKEIPIPYPYVSLIIFICCYLVYIFLSTQRVENFPDYHKWGVDLKRTILITSLLVAYGMAGVKYFIDNVREVFRMMEPAPGCQKKIAALNAQLEERFTKSKTFYIVLFLIIIPFYGIDLIHGDVYLYTSMESFTIASMTIDIFNNIAALLIFYTMAMILWIIINTKWALSEVEGGYHEHIVKIDLFNVDDVGGLKPISNLILKLVVYQFIAVSLATINFIGPDVTKYKEIIVLTILFIITVYFFISSWYLIKIVLEEERERKINSINELYMQQNEREQYIIIANDEYWNKEDKLEGILNSINFLHDERGRVKEASKHVYNLKSIFIFISSSLIPLITNITAFLNPVTSPEGSELSEQIIPTMICFNQTALPIIKEYLLTYI